MNYILNYVDNKTVYTHQNALIFVLLVRIEHFTVSLKLQNVGKTSWYKHRDWWKLMTQWHILKAIQLTFCMQK